MTPRTKRDWTIVQLLYRDPVPVDERHPMGWSSRCEKYVVDVGLKSAAEVIVERWLEEDQERRKNLNEVHYYPRNYVDLERQLRLDGRVIT